MNIPSETDWGDWQDDLDRESAHQHFAGKNLDEAFELFAEHALFYYEDLQWMPKIPFQYYIQAYQNYLLSVRSKDDSDGASCYLRLIENRLETEPDQILDVFESLLPTMKTVANRQEFYESESHIYGDFKEILASIIEKYNSQVAE